MTSAPIDEKVSFGSFPVCERCFTLHVGQCTIKCHKCGNVRHKARYCKEKNVSTCANTQPILTCYDYGLQGHTRNRFLMKVKQKEIREVCGRVYLIKDAEPQGLNVVTVNHLFKIGLMPMELVTFDVIIGMDWLIKHDAVNVCGKKVVHIPYGNKMLIVESDKEEIERKRLEDMPVIHDFPKVFPDDLTGLPPPRQVEFQIYFTTVGTRVKTVSESYYCQYKDVTTSQDEVSAA
uniref:Reverse transcriptase domain-containing protein n=1 Tax=Tanacetum cinerariifolium TaxID=118510 RepID=A0A6L2LU00_TANCI|nr:hypothetical protein [Tanacetum cinerariifolium]